MARPVDFAKLSPRAQEFFKNKAASKKAAAKAKSKGSKGAGAGGGS